MREKEVMTATGIQNDIVISMFKRMEYQIYQRTVSVEKNNTIRVICAKRNMHIYNKNAQ